MFTYVQQVSNISKKFGMHEVAETSLCQTSVQSLANISRLFRCSRAAPCRRDGPCRWTPRSCQSWRYSAASLDHSWRPYWGRGIPRGPRPSPLSRKHTADCRHPIHEQNPEKTHHILKRYVHQDVNTYVFMLSNSPPRKVPRLARILVQPCLGRWRSYFWRNLLRCWFNWEF